MKRLVSACVVIAAGLASCLVAAPHFSTTLQEVVVVSEDPVLFGAVPVGTTSPPHSITLSPPGTTATTDQINTITPMCTDFGVQTPMGLPGTISRICTGSGGGSVTAPTSFTCTDQVYTFTGTFSPAVAGTSSCAVVLGLDSGSQTITFTGSGTSPMLQIDVQPPNINFGGVPTGSTSTAATLTVRNAGSAPLTVNSVAVTTNPSAVYALSPTVGMHTIAVGGSENYSITCAPPTASQFDGAVTVASNDPTRPSINVPLKCTGINSDLAITPSPVTFPSARVGEPPGDITVNIHYSGGSTRTITGITFDNGSTPELSFTPNPPTTPITLGSGTNDTSFKLHYSAATARSMGPMGGVTVAAMGLTNQDVIVNGAALQTSMSLTPAVVDLGPVCSGTMAHADVDVFANNTGSFQLMSVTGLSTPFSLSNFTPGTVQGGSHAMFRINVQPTMPGDLSQLASVNTDIPGMPTHDLMVKAEALPSGVTPTPNVVQFGTWMIGAASTIKKVQLTNCTTTPLTLNSATVDGSTDFKVVTDPPIMNHVIDPMTSFEIDMLLIPSSAGAKTANLVLATDAGQQVVELDGAATGASEGGGKDRESYYACGAGRVVSLWPIALALVVLRRRRRR